MERRKLDLDYIQLFPRTVEHGLAPQHVEQSDFVAERRYVEGFGDAWLLHQQKPPHLVAHVQFATDEADFHKKLGTAIALQQLHEYIEGNFTFFCMLAGINADEVPPTWPDRIRIPVRALSAATRWWLEYGKEVLLLKDVYFCAKVFKYRCRLVSVSSGVNGCTTSSSLRKCAGSKIWYASLVVILSLFGEILYYVMMLQKYE